MSSWAWFLPFLSGLFFLVALFKLGKSANKLVRQAKRLDKQLATFKSTDHSDSLEPFKPKLGKPEEAVANRRAYLNQRTKKKTDRQRRLVNRLRNLTSKESENPNV